MFCFTPYKGIAYMTAALDGSACCQEKKVIPGCTGIKKGRHRHAPRFKIQNPMKNQYETK